jgi:hypothetical protein
MSKQIQQFGYRVPERPGTIYQTIPIGGQVRISPNGAQKDLSTPEIDAILGQHATYGIVCVDDIDNKQNPFSGLCYSIGKAISPEKLRRAMLKKEEALSKFGKQIRQEAALAVNSQIEGQVGPLHQLEMSFEEIEPRGGYSDDVDHIAEGVRVTRQAENGPPIPMRGRR